MVLVYCKTCDDPKIVFINPDVYVIVYTNQTSHPLEISTVRAKDPTLPWYRGVYKYGSANIYADEKNVYASIITNDNSEYHITLSGITPNNWYYIVLTFDGSKIRLYCNNENTIFTKSSITYKEIDMPTPKTIKILPICRLYFGIHYYGNIDEVAIHNVALTDSEVNYHFQNPTNWFIN